MKDELVWALAFDFPRLYTGLRKTYTYAHFQGVNCADGWEPIVRWLSGQIERLIELEPIEEQELYRAIEVRERHGGLEFYMNDATEAMQKLIGLQSWKALVFANFVDIRVSYGKQIAEVRKPFALIVSAK